MKQHLYIFTLIGSIMFLSGCGWSTPETPSHTKKTPFILHTEPLENFRSEITREKTATLQASSTLSLSSESAGTVNAISVREGQAVSAWTPLITLKDSLNNYDLAVAQAKNGVILQEASSDTTRVNLENSVLQAEIAYNRALQDATNIKNRRWLQYDTLVKKNRDTLATINDAYKNHLTDLERSMTHYLHEADKIIGVTSENQWKNSAWKAYLWAQSGVNISRAEKAWNTVYSVRWEIRKQQEKRTDFTSDDAHARIALLERAYEASRELGDAMLDMLHNSVVGGGLSTETLAWWTAAWNGFRTAIQGSDTGFITWKSQTNTFLENYQQDEFATKLAVHSLQRPLSAEEFNSLQNNSDLKLSYENTKISLDEQEKAAQLALEHAEKTLENTKKLRDATIKQLRASTENARLTLAQAERQASRLVVRAPIDGVITRIHAEVWQSVNIGTLMLEFAGKDPQAHIEIDPRTALLLGVGDSVTAQIEDATLTGSITSVSRVAGKNMLSSVRIAFPEWGAFIWRAANIVLSIPEMVQSAPTYLIPINAVTIIAEGEGKISIFRDGNISTQSVRLGNMYGKHIEVITDIDAHTSIITHDISAYNENDYTLQQAPTESSSTFAP